MDQALLSFADAAQILLTAIYEDPQRISVVYIVKEKNKRDLVMNTAHPPTASQSY